MKTTPPHYQDVGRYFRAARILLGSIGVIFAPTLTYKNNYLMKVLFIITALGASSGLCSELLYEYEFFRLKKPLMQFTELSIYVCYTILSILKFYRIVRKRHKIDQIVHTLYNIYPTNPNNEHCVSDFQIQKFYRYTLLFTIPVSLIMLGTALVFSVLPIMCYVLKSSEEQDKVSLVDILPFLMWYPYEVTSWQIYWLSFLQQTHCGFVYSLCNVGVDSLLNCIIMQLCMHLDALSTRLLRLNPAETKNIEEEIFQIVENHNSILKLMDDVNDIFALPIFFTVFMASGLLCFVGFQVVEGTKSADFWKYIMFLIYETSSTFQVCLVGDLLTEKSLEVGDSAYKSKWFEGSKKHQQLIQLIIVRSQKAVSLDAFTFHNVSLATYKQIGTSAYQFLTLLRTMYDR